MTNGARSIQLFVAFFFLASLLGCGIRLKGYERFEYLRGENPKEIAQRVLWLGVLDLAGYGPEAGQAIESGVLSRLERAKGITLVKKDELRRYSLNYDEKSGRFQIPRELKIISDQEGAKIAAQVILTDPSNEVRRSGIWPLRKTRLFISVNIRAVVMDLLTETVLLNEVTKKEIPFYYDPLSEDDPSIYQEAFEKATKHLIKGLSTDIISAVQEFSWLTYITGVDGQQIEIPVGRLSGIKVGMLFNSYEKAEELRAYDGRVYPIFGKKTGTLRVREVFENKSYLEIVSGSNFSKGQILRLIK